MKFIDMFEVLDNKMLLGFEEFQFRFSLFVIILTLNILHFHRMIELFFQL